MQRTKIEWVKNPDGSPGFTYNPFTGCLHGCNYCYARKIANRFQPDKKGREAIKQFCEYRKFGQVYVLDNPIRMDGKAQQFPFGFQPTFHRYRLDEPLRRKKPSTIFVNDMSDIMGKWWNPAWVNEIIDVMKEAKQHMFLLLTKNPERYHDFVFFDNVWLGQSVDMTNDLIWQDVFKNLNGITERNFISFEPLLKSKLHGWKPRDIIKWVKPRWVIVGAQSRPAKLSSTQDVIDIIEHCQIFDDNSIPVFLKNNLQSFFPDQPLMQEFPCNYISNEG